MNPHDRDDDEKAQEKPKRDEDIHGTPFRRVPGPGPEDADKGAAGEDAVKRIERHD